jgi:hypothetical protein
MTENPQEQAGPQHQAGIARDAGGEPGNRITYAAGADPYGHISLSIRVEPPEALAVREAERAGMEAGA